MRDCVRGQDPLRRRLSGVLGLGDDEAWLVILCAAVEVFPEAAAAASILSEQDGLHLMTPMTFARLMRAALGVPVEVSLAEGLDGGMARRLALVDVPDPSPSRPFSQQGIRLNAAELAPILADGQQVGRPQSDVTETQLPAKHCVYDPQTVAGAAAALDSRGLLCVRAPSARAARQFGLDLASHYGASIHYVTAREDLPPAASVLRVREGLAYLDVFAYTRGKPSPVAYVDELARTLPRLVVGMSEDAASGHWPVAGIDALDYARSCRVWGAVLDDERSVDRLAHRFRVNVEEARAAVQAASDALDSGQATACPSDRIAAEVLRQGSRRMARSVVHLRTANTMDRLVAPPRLRRKLDEMIVWYEHSGRVFGEMGLGDGGGFGTGLTALFSGPPGTGKTFAAQCLANRFGLNLYRIDLSQVVSKYIGETEKALAAVFDEADAGHGLLLFDEADALFGKRSEVKDAHDRYANIEVGYLLQRLETFGGVVVLATNMRNNIDPAFLRRIRFLLDFPMPDQDMRRRLWEQALPPARWRDAALDLDPFVQQFRLAGGNIGNIGMLAAHLAAAGSGRVSTEDLVRATFRELEKTGLPRSPVDFGPLAVHLGEEATA
ncbi:MAG: ATP-binding protein [Actinobacteria bacterium]|nr:ATP-binding protein [Actinomycetota bacterium]